MYVMHYLCNSSRGSGWVGVKREGVGWRKGGDGRGRERGGGGRGRSVATDV